MKVADFLVDCLIRNGAADVFGLPGEVVLEFLDALDRRREEIRTHLCYHEQAGLLEACGYAQASGKLGVAYATKGPGIMNMMSAIQDAYCDSVPIVIVTAHESLAYTGDMRFKDNQELDTERLLRFLAKSVVRIDDLNTAAEAMERSILLARSGRPGPVVLDFSSSLLSSEFVPQDNHSMKMDRSLTSDCSRIAAHIIEEIDAARRPVILIGDGIRQSKTTEITRKFLEHIQVPVLTSRFSQDIIGGSELNYGYIGSHAVRCSNTILRNCDLIVSLGNRMAYNPESETFAEIAKRARTIRIDIDSNEFTRIIPNSEQYLADLADLMPILAGMATSDERHRNWRKVCDSIREILIAYDTEEPVRSISAMIRSIGADTIITSDVGNNEFWLSRAYTLANASNRVLFSKSFGLLGCSMPKAIGAQIATDEPVVCFTGDQGFHLNLQELQFVSTHSLPILIIVINNNSSGMILSKQRKRKSDHFLHTTAGGGYFAPPLHALADAYGMSYHGVSCDSVENFEQMISGLKLPCLVEFTVPDTADISPTIPFGNRCDEFIPRTRDEDQMRLDALLTD